MTGAFLTEQELADQFGISLDKLQKFRRAYRWPCVKLGRFDIRYTPAQVEQIVAMQTHASTGKKSKPATTGQTARSRALGKAT